MSTEQKGNIPGTGNSNGLGGQPPHPQPDQQYGMDQQQMGMNDPYMGGGQMMMGGGPGAQDMYGNMIGSGMPQGGPSMGMPQGQGNPYDNGGLGGQMVQGFANMNLGMHTMVQSKPRGRGGGRGGDRRGGGDRGGHARERDTRKDTAEAKDEKHTGRELAKMCNPELKSVNPEDFVIPDFARMFVIKSQSEDDVHKSIKQGIWASTKNGNEKLMAAWREHGDKCPIYLFFSVNASGQFLGVAQMMNIVDVNKKFNAWAQENKWQGQFNVKWTFLKDIPNKEFRHITLENNEGKPVTNSRDCQEVPLLQGKTILEIFKNHPFTTTIMDDFGQYDKRQQDMETKRGLKSQKKPDHDE